MHNTASDSGKAQSSKANANGFSGAGQKQTYAPPAFVFDTGYNALADATAENGAAFFGRAEYAYPTLGFTTTIRNHDGPEINFRTVRKQNQWYSKPILETPSQEGDNDSWALDTGNHLVPNLQEQGKPVYSVISAPIAAQIIAAENEHVADYRYAKSKILDVADNWLTREVRRYGHNGEFGPSRTKDDVIALAEAGINPPLKAAIGLTGVEDFTWANIGAYYKHAADQTQKRDENDWHSFDSDETVLDDRVNKTTTAGTTEIGTHGSADVIDLTEVTD